MSFSYAELIYRTVAEAQRGSQKAQTENLDTQGIAEAMMPSIFQAVSEKCAGDERKRALLKRDKSLTFASGQVTLPSDVLKAYLEDSTLGDGSDPTKRYSWYRNMSDFVDQSLTSFDLLVGGYCNDYGDVLLLREPGSPYDGTAGGARVLNVPCSISLPASATAVVDAPDEVINDLIDFGAEMLRGALIQAAKQAA